MKDPALRTCPHCGADCEVGKPRCWLCHGELAGGDEIVDAELVQEVPPHAPSDMFFVIAAAILAVVVLLIGVGAALTQPGLAIAMAIVVAPALVATLVRTRKQQKRQGYVSWGERLATFAISVAVMMGVLSALGAAVMVALVIFCFYALATGQFNFHGP